MSYTKHDFKSGDKLYASQLNEMDAQIQANEKAIENCQPKGDYVTDSQVDEKIAQAQFGGSDAPDLSGYLTETEADGKYQPKGDYLTEHQQLKTVNGQSLVGSGNLEISANITEEQINTAVSAYLDDNPVAAYVDYDLNVKAVNHMGYNKGAPENTIPAYILSKKNGYSYVECDVQFTADNVAVLIHDDTIDATSNGVGNISDMTYEQALQYDFGSWFSSEYAGVKIPTFTEFIVLCKRLGLHPYIELKAGKYGYTSEQIVWIVNEVKKHSMTGKVTYISFENTYLGYVKDADASARLGYLVERISAIPINRCVDLKTATNEVFVDAYLDWLTEDGVNRCINAGLPLEVWTVNSEEKIREMPAYVSGVTSDNLIAGKVLHDAAMTYTPPESTYVPATGITLDKNVLTFTVPDEQIIVATVEPSDASDKVVWKSSSTDVATVSDGVVTPVADGSCTITATAGGVSATCSVTVEMAQNIHVITRNLTGCTSSSNVSAVVSGSAHTETITANGLYTLDGAEVTITMGGVDISDNFVNGVLTIASVTDDIVIAVTAVSTATPPVVDLTLTNVTDGVLRNTGSGGNTYDVNVTNGEYTSDANGLTLGAKAYADVPYSLSKSSVFTIHVRGCISEKSGMNYERVIRTNNDALCVFYNKTNGLTTAKITNSTSGITVKSTNATIVGNGITIKQGVYDLDQMHDYVFVGDGTTVYFYIDGELLATQTESTMSTITSFGMGNTDPTVDYYANKLTFSAFRIYDYAMTAEEVAGL